MKKAETTKATKAKKAKAAKTPKATKATAIKAKAKPTKATPPPAAQSKPETPPPVKLPAHFDLPNDGGLTITKEAIILAVGLREVIFDPAKAYQWHEDKEIKTRDGQTSVMQKGWVSLCRGNFHVGIKTPEIIAAIMAAKAAANEAKANKKVVQK